MRPVPRFELRELHPLGPPGERRGLSQYASSDVVNSRACGQWPGGCGKIERLETVISSTSAMFFPCSGLRAFRGCNAALQTSHGRTSGRKYLDLDNAVTPATHCLRHVKLMLTIPHPHQCLSEEIADHIEGGVCDGLLSGCARSSLGAVDIFHPTSSSFRQLPDFCHTSRAEKPLDEVYAEAKRQ